MKIPVYVISEVDGGQICITDMAMAAEKIATSHARANCVTVSVVHTGDERLKETPRETLFYPDGSYYQGWNDTLFNARGREIKRGRR